MDDSSNKPVTVVDLTRDESDNNDNQDIIILDESITIDDRPSHRSLSSSSSRSALVVDIPESPPPPTTPPRMINHLIRPHNPFTATHHLPPPKPAQPPRPSTPPGDALKCPICIESYVNVKKRGLKVVVTRCGHIFCDFCLKKAISGNGRKCPKCRKNVPKGPTGIIEIFDVC